MEKDSVYKNPIKARCYSSIIDNFPTHHQLFTKAVARFGTEDPEKHETSTLILRDDDSALISNTQTQQSLDGKNTAATINSMIAPSFPKFIFETSQGWG